MTTISDSKEHDPAQYGAQWAHDYDLLNSAPPAFTEGAVRTLTQLAGSGTILEVAAGTGRVSIPLARLGIDVTATDASPDMLAALGIADQEGLVRRYVDVLPDISGSERHSAIAILMNSFWVMQSKRDQQQFFENAREHLGPEGVLVTEVGVVDTNTWKKPLAINLSGLAIVRTTVWDPAQQIVEHTFTFPDGTREPKRQVRLRYTTPDELLEMAATAGLKPRSIWGDWNETPFGPDSWMMITIFEQSGV